MESNLDILNTFTIDTLPDLDVVTLGALELFKDSTLPQIDFHQFKRPLVVGSGNAFVTGKMLFDDVNAIFADESSYKDILETHTSIDGAFLISAGGGKHAIEIAQALQQHSLTTILLTNNKEAPARGFLAPENIVVFPKNREPYTYNTSTYMGMLLSKTYEDEQSILDFIHNEVISKIPKNLSSYTAFYLIVPENFSDMCEMFRTKFDELFGPKLMGRVFTYEQTKHAKTVVQDEKELFISFGVENTIFGNGENRIFIPLPEDADYVTLLAIGYFCIGHVQKQFPPYYKNRIEAYTKEASDIFGSTITPIVS